MATNKPPQLVGPQLDLVLRKNRALAALVIAVTITAPACRSSDASGDKSSTDIASFIAVDPTSTSPTDKAIATAQTQLKTDPTNDNARLSLAQAYLQKARETADPSLYVKADGLLKTVKKTQSKNPGFWLTEGTLALAQHRFKDGLSDGNSALKLDPNSEGAYGVLVDANNELGNQEAALAATQSMADIHPDLDALSRVSYARELRGDLPGAIEAMTQAVTAGGSAGGENVAYVQVLLGNLLLEDANVSGAETAYEQALVSFPDFAAAQAGQAQVLVARGKYGEAADLLNDVISRQPVEIYAINRGDDLAAAGHADDATQAYALVDVINKLFAANGVNVDREAALFDADHHATKATVAQARKALISRGSLAGHDTLAWALYRTGQLKEAAKESDVALSAGNKDPQQHFHAAVIAMAQNNTAKAKTEMQEVLSTNPRFSAVFIGQVTDMATKLGLTMPPPAP